MKKILIALFVFLSINTIAQEKQTFDHYIEFGYGGISNQPVISVVQSMHINELGTSYWDKGRLPMYHLEIGIPSKIKNTNYVLGSKLLNGYLDRWSEGKTNTVEEFYGGGVYAGIKTSVGKPKFGISAKITGGFFSFKHFVTNYYADLKETEVFNQSSGPFGGMATLSLYAKVKRIRINLEFHGIYSGGGNSSFIFNGFNLPVAYYF